MTTINSLDKRAVFSIAGDLDNIHDNLRITQDMLMDLLCDFSLTDFDAVKKMHERIFYLVEKMPTKLDELNALNDKLLALSHSTTLTA